MNAPEISILIPVRNRQQTLPHCINSILQSRFQKFEILLIDDGSTDNSLEVCRQYAAQDTRIRSFSIIASGVSTARNLGIDNAKGKWITFIDSDDAILPHHLNALLATQDSDIECIMKSFRSGIPLPNEGIKIHPDMKFGLKEIYEKRGNQAIIEYLFGEGNPYKNHFYNCTNKFFKRDIIQKHQIRFRTDVNLGEDQIFVLEYLKHIHSMLIYKERTYVMLRWKQRNNNQLTKQPRSLENLEFNICENYKALCDFYNFSKSQQVFQYAENYLIEQYMRRIFLPFTKEWRKKGFSSCKPDSKQMPLRLPKDDSSRMKINVQASLAFCQQTLVPLLLKHRKTTKYIHRFSLRWRAWCLLHFPLQTALSLCCLPSRL